MGVQKRGLWLSTKVIFFAAGLWALVNSGPKGKTHIVDDGSGAFLFPWLSGSPFR